VNEELTDLEAALIRETVSRIRKRMREKERGGKIAFPPRLAVKFCGGCNPEIDRGRIAQGVCEELAGETIRVSGEEEPGFLLIINGCRTACADTPETRSGRPAVVVAGETVDE
jgi:hypothetical protein